MKRRVYLIGGFSLGWRKILLQLADAAVHCRNNEGLDLTVRRAPTEKCDNFHVDVPGEETEVEFTVLKWNEISGQYYQLGPLGFWSKVIKMYLRSIRHADWSVVARLPKAIVVLFLIAPFLAFLVFSLLSFCCWFLLELLQTPQSIAITMTITASAIGTYLALDSASFTIFLRGLLFSSDSVLSKPGLLDDHINSFKNRILEDIQSEEYDEVVILGFSHGCKLLTLLMSELYKTCGNNEHGKIKAIFVAQYLPLGLMLKNKTKLKDAVLHLKQLDKTYFNVFNSIDFICSSQNNLFFPFDERVRANIVNLDTKYHKYLKKMGRLKAQRTLHYAHTLYFRPLDKPCPHSLIRILCSPLYVEKNPAFIQPIYPDQPAKA